MRALPALAALLLWVVASGCPATPIARGEHPPDAGGGPEGAGLDAGTGGAGDGGTVQAPPPLPGFADLHVHQFAEHAFGGAWFWGAADGEAQQALADCGGGALVGGDHARTTLSALNELLGQVPGSSGDTGWHFGKARGFPDYAGWPRWDTIAHQQVWGGHLKQAHDAGLTLMVMSAVNFKPLCDLMPEQNRDPGRSCDDMEAVDRQLDAAWAFDAAHDWFEIALTPADARRIVGAGKLAVVLSIEVSDLFGAAGWQAELARYHGRGVRTLQLAHQLDNRFSGVAPHHWIFKVFQLLGRDTGFQLDESGHNLKGLSEEGRLLAAAMMERGMMVDLAHLSERAVQELVELSAARGHFPLYMSHGHFRSAMTGEKEREEKSAPDWMVKEIRKTGGLFGLRTGAEQVKTYLPVGVPNDCDGSTRSFAQTYGYGALGLKVDLAFASDFNGFIQQLRPRFGDGTEACGASGDATRRAAQQAAQTAPSGTALDHAGLGHIGLEPDVLAELKAFGVDTSNLQRSTEGFVRMWERSLAADRAGPLPADDFDTSGLQP